jgi:hypothetical protein
MPKPARKSHAKRAKPKHLARRPRSKAIVPRAPLTVSEAVEKCLIVGDLTPLTVEQRLEYYKTLCKSLGLNPLTRPFEYIVFTNRDEDDVPDNPQQQQAPQGKMVLYARADCAAQLRKIHKVGIRPRARRYREGEFYNVEIDLFTLDGRTDTAIGIVPLKKWKRVGSNPNAQKQLVDLNGRELANAMMKAETKAKRRGTLSICGLHMLDESELDGLVGYGTVTPGGRRMITIAPGAESLEEGADLYEHAVELARLDKDSQLPFKELVAHYEQKLRSEAKMTPQQREAVENRPAAALPPRAPAPAPAPAQTPPPTPRPAPAAKPSYAREMTYFWNETYQEALIEGSNQIKAELKQVLGRYVRPPKFEIRVNGDELEQLKWELKSRDVKFTRRYPKV